MCFIAVNWASKQLCDTASQKLVLMLLAVHRNSDTGRCNPSQKLLAAECCMSLRNVITQLQGLADLGLIKIVQIKENNNHLPNQYELKIEGEKGKKSPLGNLNSNEYEGNAVPIGNKNTAKNEQEKFDFDSFEDPHANSARGVMQDLQEGHAKSAQGVVQDLHEGHADSAYKYINKYSFTLSLSEEEKNCFLWARENSFWRVVITSEEKFLELYRSKNPMGLKTQYFKEINKQQNYDGGESGQFKKYNGTERRQYTPAERVARAAGFQVD